MSLQLRAKSNTIMYIFTSLNSKTRNMWDEILTLILKYLYTRSQIREKSIKGSQMKGVVKLGEIGIPLKLGIGPLFALAPYRLFLSPVCLEHPTKHLPMTEDIKEVVMKSRL